MPRFLPAIGALVLLAVTELFESSLVDPRSPWVPAMFAVLTVAVPGLLARTLLRMTRRTSQVWATFTTALPLVGFAGMVFTGGRVWIDAAVPPHIVGLSTALLLLPPLLGWAHIAAHEVAAENRNHRITERLGPGVLRAVRPLLLVFGGYSVIQAVSDAGLAVPGAREVLLTHPGLALVGSIGMFGGILALSPYAVRLLHPARPLPAGPLRDRLESLAHRADITVRHIQVWDTGPRPVINACVAGVLPWNRSVFITDGLLEVLAPDEVEAVFAHELAHGKHHHLWLFIGLIVGCAGLVLAGPRWITSWAGGALDPLGTELFVLLVVGLGFHRFFGRLSRHLEGQADLFSADRTGNPFGIVSALQRIGTLTGAIHRPRSWRHPPIPHRIETVLGCWDDPLRRARFARRTRRLLLVWGAVLLLGGAGWSMEWRTWTTAPEWSRAIDRATVLLDGHDLRARRPWEDAEHERAVLERSASLLREALVAAPPGPEHKARRAHAYQLLAYSYEELGLRWDAAVARYLGRGAAPPLPPTVSPSER